MKTKLSLVSAMIILIVMSAKSNAQITITFKVNAANTTVQEMHIAGQFATTGSATILEDWQPAAPGSIMPLTGSGEYAISVDFPETAIGSELQFLFVRSDTWTSGNTDFSEGNPGETHLNSSCGVDDGGGGFNRAITIPATDAEYTTAWDYCGTLSVMQCLAPTAFGAVVDQQQAKLNWVGTAYADRYRVRYHAEGSVNNWKIKSFPDNVSVVTLSNLLPETVYGWSVSSLCGNSYSGWSPVQYFTTDPLRLGETNEKEKEFQLYPNPTNGKFSIVVNAPADNESSLLITDITGRVIIQENFRVPEESFERRYNISNEPCGAYLLRLETEGHIVLKKLYLFK